MSTPDIGIGTRLTVLPTAQKDDKIWIAECPDLPDGWECDIMHRAEITLVKGQPLTGWVLSVEPSNRQVIVSDSNFGFLPISDRMRPRYVNSLRRLAALFERATDLETADVEVLSEVKGMFSRCARHDQWDWRAVQLALGEPSRDIARGVATKLGEIASTLHKGDAESARDRLIKLATPDLIRLVQSAASSIAESAPPLARALTGPSRPCSEQRASHEVEKSSIVSTYSKAKLDVANAAHTELLTVLGTFLSSCGYRVEANQFVDAFARLKSGPAIFEAKSLTDDNELTQVRHGLSQLYEYRFRHGLTNASLWLVLSRPLKVNWLVDYLEKDRGVHVLWRNEGELVGPFVNGLVESGSNAIRRKGVT